MTRRKARTDDNQAGIVRDLRKLGFSVAITSGVADGFPDLVVGAKAINFLFECKDPAQPPSKRKLTPDQQDFHRTWNGQIAVIETTDDALAIIYAARR